MVPISGVAQGLSNDGTTTASTQAKHLPVFVTDIVATPEHASLVIPTKSERHTS